MTDLATIIHTHREVCSLRADIEYACSRDKDWVQINEAANMLGVSKQFVVDLAKRGVLVSVRGIRTWVYRQSVVDRIEYIKEHGKPTRGGPRKKGEVADNDWLKQHYPELSKEVWS